MTEEQIQIESIIKELSDMPESWYFKEKIDLFISGHRTLQQQNKQLIDGLKRIKDEGAMAGNNTYYHMAKETLQQIQGNT